MTGAGRFKKGGVAKFRKLTDKIAQEYAKPKPSKTKIKKLVTQASKQFKKRR